MDFSARKKSIISYLASFLLSIFFLAVAPVLSSNALAQGTPQYNTPNFNPEVPRNQHTFTQAAMIEIASSVFCVITGIDPITPAQGCLDIDPKTHKLGLRPPQDGKPQLGGLMGFLPGMFAVVYTPPASGIDYFRYLAGNFGITQPAYAQTGGGFEALRPLLPLWTAARNIAYLLFVLVFIIIGLAIMLRVKIDPRTVMTLQNQIPRIIVGILLVTFSYAIAGIMIDGMWLLTYAGINAITQASANSNPVAANCGPNDSTLQQRATKNLISTPFTYANEVLKIGCGPGYLSGMTHVTWRVGNAMGSTAFEILKDILPTDGDWFVVGAPPINLLKLVSWILTGILSALAGILALIIVFLALLWAMFTLWIELLKAYVMLILYIIGAPLWIVTGLLPGKPLGFEKWLRRMFVHLAVFPAVACLLMVASVLMNIFNNAGAGAFVPPLVGQSNMSGFGSLLAFAVILMAPTLLEVLKENLHATSKGGALAAGGVVRGISGGAAAPKGLGSKIGSYAFGIDPRTGVAGPGLKYLAGPNEKSWRNRLTQIAFGNFDTDKTFKGKTPDVTGQNH